MNECLTTPQHKKSDRLLGIRKRSDGSKDGWMDVLMN